MTSNIQPDLTMIDYSPPYFIIPTGLPPTVLDEMVKDVSSLEGSLDKATVVGRQVNEKLRKSRVEWIAPDNWVSCLMSQLVHYANQEFFHLDLTCWTGAIQYTHYEKGSFYGWHTDASSSFAKENEIRKLSISLLVSDPEDYEGGELQFHTLHSSSEVKLNKGDAIIFSSMVAHRVKKVKSGVRKSLVGWMGGPPWR